MEHVVPPDGSAIVMVWKTSATCSEGFRSPEWSEFVIEAMFALVSVRISRAWLGVAFGLGSIVIVTVFTGDPVAKKSIIRGIVQLSRFLLIVIGPNVGIVLVAPPVKLKLLVMPSVTELAVKVHDGVAPLALNATVIVV